MKKLIKNIVCKSMDGFGKLIVLGADDDPVKSAVATTAVMMIVTAVVPFGLLIWLGYYLYHEIKCP